MGSGYRTFTAGEVLTASNVQNYLQDQVVMTFGGSAARSSAIGTANFEEGMISYLTDTDKVEAYNGTNWVQVGASTQGLTLINTTSFSGVTAISAPASTFTSTYANYKILFDLTSVAGDNTLFFRLRSSGSDDTGANYNHAILGYDTNNATAGFAANTSVNGFYVSEFDAGTNNHSYSITMDIFRPNEAQFTTFSMMAQMVSTAGVMKSIFGGGWLKTSTQYDAVTFSNSNNFAGRMSIYGYNL